MTLDKYSAVGDIPYVNAQLRPDKTAIIYNDKRIKWDEFNKRINRLANWFISHGIEKGDIVALLFYNGNEFLETLFALLKIGAVAVPLNFRQIPEEIKWTLDNSKCIAVIYSSRLANLIQSVKSQLYGVKLYICDGDNIPEDEYSYEKICFQGNCEEPSVVINPDDWAVVIFTGGTTGTPKGAIYSHYTLLNTFKLIGLNVEEITDNDIFLNQPPLFHGGGMLHVLSYLAHGACVYLFDSMDAEQILRGIEKEKVTDIFLVPPLIFFRLVEQNKTTNADLSSITAVIGAAGACSMPLVDALFEIFPNGKIYIGWGCTEISGGISNVICRDTLKKYPWRLNSVGQCRAPTILEIKIIDKSGNEVPVGEVGEAIVKSTTNFIGYLDQPELTAGKLKNGWVYTGDLMSKDKDGYFYFIDRMQNIIKSGGEKIYGTEVENALLTCPEVQEAAVIGSPDPIYSEIVCAVVKLHSGSKLTEDDLVQWCRQRISSYKKPKKIFFVDEFPRNESGKILKNVLKEKYSNQSR